MTSLEVKKFNAYPELKTADLINRVIQFVEYIHDGLLPDNPLIIQFFANVNNRQKQRYYQKFSKNWVVKQDVLIAHGNIIHRKYLMYMPAPNNVAVPLLNNRIQLRVIPPLEYKRRLTAIYNDDRQGLGLGQNAFYNFVCSKYIGINRVYTTSFLKRQGNYMVTRPYKKVINRPIMAKVPNERWGIDLIFMNQYIPPAHPAGIRNILNNDNPLAPQFAEYILTVVDYFSKYVWARPLREKTALNVLHAIQNICQASHTQPHIIQADNGTEFRGVFRDWCAQQNILQISTQPYTPTSNGLVERMNREVRKKINEGFAKHNNIEWVSHLQNYTENINNQRHSKSKYKPIELWSQGYHPLPINANVNLDYIPNDHSTIAQIREAVSARAIASARRQVVTAQKRHAPAVFVVGDKVRIALNETSSEIKKRLKEKKGKLTAIKFSPEIYVVHSVVGNVPTNENLAGAPLQQIWNIVRQRYTLSFHGIIYGGENPKMFYGNQLIRVPLAPFDVNNNAVGNTPATVNSATRARYINRFTNV